MLCTKAFYIFVINNGIYPIYTMKTAKDIERILGSFTIVLLAFMMPYCAKGQINAKTIEEYREKAERGVKEARYNLGLCYANGKGVVKSYKEAAKWFRKAAGQGNENAKKILIF